MFRSTSVPTLYLTGLGALLLLSAGCGAGPGAEDAPMPETTVELTGGWSLVAAAEVEADGAAVSQPGFDVSAWTSATLPTTVLAALVADGQHEEPYFGRNLEAIPTEPFEGPWWYRVEFPFPGAAGNQVRLVLEGINYRADIWLNGTRVASREEIVGAFRQFELNVTEHLVDGANALAIRVHPPQPGDPTIGFVDWNPTPPDRNMGVWRPVKLRTTGAVAVDELVVESELDLDTLAAAELTVAARVSNLSDEAVTAAVSAVVDDVGEVEQTVELAAGESRRVVFTAADHPVLAVDNPHLWWPVNMGEPNLYRASMTSRVDGAVTDHREESFGIRHIADYKNEEGHRGYIVNGRKTLIRGGGWVDDLMLADDPTKVEDQMRYVKQMNLNTVRLEGFWGSNRELFHLADRHGILVMVGWSCQWEWEDYLGGPVDEFGGIDTADEIDLVARSLRDQVVWLRNHPSIFVWVLASDMLPRPELERRYLAELEEVDTTRPALAACAVATSEVSGPTGVKMNGPYDYVPPVYWYTDLERGGAYGFNTETGPGPQPPPASSIRRMMPEEDWWPVNEMWDYHSGRNAFETIERYHRALDARYGESDDLDDFARKAQAANYEAMRAMFEAFVVRRPLTTGIVQWMLNSAWPELYWQLYDHYLVPNGAFYGALNANRPVNLIFDHGTRGLVAVNDTTGDLGAVEVRVRAFDADSNLLADDVHTVELGAETMTEVVTVGDSPVDSGVWFLDARMNGSDGAELARSLYWLPAVDDEMDWEGSEWHFTPIGKPADLTALETLPATTVEVDHEIAAAEGGSQVAVRLTNTGDKIAFLLELRVEGETSGLPVAPILWDDNYVILLPGESREIRGWWPAHALEAGDTPVFGWSGWNTEG